MMHVLKKLHVGFSVEEGCRHIQGDIPPPTGSSIVRFVAIATSGPFDGNMGPFVGPDKRVGEDRVLHFVSWTKYDV